MSSKEPSNPVVARLVAAINDGDRDTFLATLTPNARLTDDGRPRDHSPGGLIGRSSAHTAS